MQNSTKKVITGTSPRNVSVGNTIPLMAIGELTLMRHLSFSGLRMRCPGIFFDVSLDGAPSRSVAVALWIPWMVSTRGRRALRPVDDAPAGRTRPMGKVCRTFLTLTEEEGGSAASGGT